MTKIILYVGLVKMQSSVHQNAPSKQKYQKSPHIGHSYISPLIDPPHKKTTLLPTTLQFRQQKFKDA